MGTTFVHIAENGFWMNDSILELWFRLAALHIDDPVKDQTLAEQIRSEWLLASRGWFTGAVPFYLEESVSSEEGRVIVVEAINSLLRSLRNGPERLSCDVLNLVGMSSLWTEDFEAWRLIEVGESLLQLIAGRTFGPASDTSFMPGSIKNLH